MKEKTQDDKEILVYSIAKPEDVEEVAKFAQEHFYNASPLRELASMDDLTDEIGFFAWRIGRIQKCFAHPTSIIVREKSTGELVAFAAIEINEKNESKETSNWPSSNPRSPGWLNRALAAELSRGVDLYDRYETNRILHFWFAAIRNDYRNQRVFSLTKITPYSSLVLKISADNKVGAWKAETFSHYAVRGKFWQVIRTINFDDFQLPDGTRPLSRVDLGVHRTACLLACRPLLLQELDRFNVKSNM